MRLCGAVSDRLLPLLFAMHPSTRHPPKRHLPPKGYPSSMSVEYISVTRQGGRINKKRVIETKANMHPFNTNPEDDNSCPPANADTVRNIAPFTCFSLFFSLFFALTHILLSRPSRPYLFLFFIPLPHACAYSIRPDRRVSPFSFIPCHVIDHLTAMCQPHGFVVTDRDCFQPIAAFVGFHVCPLLETKHGL
jgi:hypothetical protein